MSEQQIQDNFMSVLQGKKVPGMDPKWRVIARMLRNIMIKEDKLEGHLMEKRQQAFEKRIGKVLQDRYLMPKQKRPFTYKNWMLAFILGVSGVYATKEYVHFTKPLPLELTHTQEELEGQDPKLFWKKWFNNGTFIMFGHRYLTNPLPTNINGCDPDQIDLEGCLILLKKYPSNPNLLFNIGLIYHMGFDGEEDHDKAIEYYKRAAALGNDYGRVNYEYLINQNSKKK
jgi:hypothetical protein